MAAFEGKLVKVINYLVEQDVYVISEDGKKNYVTGGRSDFILENGE